MDPRVVAATVLALVFFAMAIYLAWAERRERERLNAIVRQTDFQRMQQRASLKKMQAPRAPGLDSTRRRV